MLFPCELFKNGFCYPCVARDAARTFFALVIDLDPDIRVQSQVLARALHWGANSHVDIMAPYWRHCKKYLLFIRYVLALGKPYLNIAKLGPEAVLIRAGCRGRKGRRLAPLEAQANIEALFLLRRNLPLRRDCLLLLLFWLHLRRMGARVRYIMPQRRSQLLAVVGEDLRVVCAA